MSSTQPVQTKRLKLLQNDFNIDPIKTIQSFIGSDANIIDYKANNLYIDGYYIVDVSYTTLDIDIMKIYTFYKYYSVVVDTPYHEATTQLFNYTHKAPSVDLNKCNVNVVLFPEYQIQKAYNDINGMFMYKSSLQSLTMQEVVRIKSLNEGEDKNKLYVIDIRTIAKPEQYKGFLACSRYREYPWDVLYINIPNYMLTKEKVDDLKWFMLNDYNNYIEWLDKIK